MLTNNAEFGYLINLLIHQTNSCLMLCFSEQAATSPGPQPQHHTFHFSTCRVHLSLRPGDPITLHSLVGWRGGAGGDGGSLRVSVPAGLPASHLPNDSHLNTGCGQVALEVWLSVVGKAQKQALDGKKCCSDLALCGCHEKTPLIFSFWECNWWPQTPSTSGLQHRIHRALIPQASPSSACQALVPQACPRETRDFSQQPVLWAQRLPSDLELHSRPRFHLPCLL